MKCIQNNLCVCFLVGGFERLYFLVVSAWVDTDKKSFLPSKLSNFRGLIPFLFNVVQRHGVACIAIFTQPLLGIQSAMIHSCLKF